MRTYEMPDGHHTITPGMVVPGVARLIEFLEQAFGARVVDRYEMPGGHVAHAEVKIGDSALMMGEPMEGFEPMPCMLSLYVDSGDDVDATYQRALAAGAESLEEPKNQFYGHRSARIVDPSGNKWAISAVVEELTKEDIERRMAEMGGDAG
jgi:PhnB protein